MENVTITKNNEHFEGINWVSRAVLKKSRYKPELECIHVAEEAVVPTDGVRMNVYYCKSGIENGNYKVITNNKTCIVLQPLKGCYSFPDWRSVVGTDEYWRNHETTKMVYAGDSRFFNVANIIRGIPDNRTVNYNLVEAIIHDDNWTVLTKKESISPIMFKNTDKNMVGLIALIGVTR